MMVTEEIITQTVAEGDLEQLREYAKQGVRVTSGAPMSAAGDRGSLEMAFCLVLELGADVNEGEDDNGTFLSNAASASLLTTAMVRSLVMELGADVNAPDDDGCTPLIAAAWDGITDHLRCLVVLENVLCLVELGATVDVANIYGWTVWTGLTSHMQMRHLHYHGTFTPDNVEEGEGQDYIAALVAVLRALVLRSEPPPPFKALLSSEPARVVQEGARLRARLPAYLVQRRALLDEHCPLLLPLLALVHDYMELTTGENENERASFFKRNTTEELWATGLGEAA
jgi:hypothetical protein